jgi:hypothetical protein
MIAPDATSRKATRVKRTACIAAATIVTLGATFSSANAEITIVIVRHGEKPDLGLGQLTCRGLNRSLALAPVLLSRYGKPAAIYAPNPSIAKDEHGISYAYVRPLATIEPLAIRVGKPVNIQWGMTDIEPLAARLLAAPAGTYVVAWEHHWGESLTRTLVSRLGSDPRDVPQWEDTDFDSVYVVRTSTGENGVRHATFSHDQEGLDGLPEECGYGPPNTNH